LDKLFIPEVQGHLRRSKALVALTHSSTKAAMAMLLAAVVALVVANTGAHEGFLEFFHTEVVVGVGPLVGEMSLAHIINDIFMAVFFLLVGLEIKYEMMVGELTNIRQAALPIIAACGGVLAPIVIYSIFNGMNSVFPCALQRFIPCVWTVGSITLCEKPYSIPSVGRSNGTSRNNKRLAGVPDAFQVR